MARTEWITCNACGADDVRELGLVGEWHIDQCNRCSLVYVNPAPFFEPTREFHDMSLEFQYTRFQQDVGPEVQQHDARQFRRQADEVARLTGWKVPVGKFLDIGCGSGSTVHAATGQGWDALGIDIDPALVEVGRRELKANLRCGTLPDATLPSGQFTFIRLRDVIEHLPNPYEVLVEIERLLVPGGVVLIATPNEGSLPYRMRAALGMKRTTLATVNPPHHLHSFAPATLERIVRRAGLEPVDVRTTTPIDPLYVTARNMRSARDPLRVLVWRAGQTAGLGSMLVCWARKSAASA